MQYFERAVFEYHPNNPPEYQVLLQRLGLLMSITSNVVAEQH